MQARLLLGSVAPHEVASVKRQYFNTWTFGGATLGPIVMSYLKPER